MILSAIFGFISGIAIGSFLYFSIWLFLACLCVSLLMFFSSYTLEEKDKFILKIFYVFLFALLVGIARISISDLYKNSTLDSFSNKKVVVEGIVVSEPDVRETNTKLTIEVQKISLEESLLTSEVLATKEKILVTAPVYPEYSYGDRVKVKLKLEEPKNFSNDEGRIFDYKGYLRVRGIWYAGRYPDIELLSSNNGNPIKTTLFKIKHTFTRAISNSLPEPESSLLGGLLLGSKQSLGKDLLLEFQKTGVSHIVVLSGYNIAIVASSVMSFLSFLPKNLSFGLGAISVILFTILSGGGASATRAATMVLVALFAKKFNRDYKANRVLGFVVVLMLAPNPLLLVFDPSFQLSILATIGIIFVTPILEPYFIWVTDKYGLREITTTTISTQLTVLPFLIYNTGLLSLVSLPVNILILGTIPITMFLGFATGTFGLISVYLAFIPAFLTHILLWYQLTVVHIGTLVPFGSVTLPTFSPIILVVIYVVVFYSLYLIKKKN